MTADDARQHSPPDPSTLTTQALWREVSHLKELTFTRLDSIEKAIDLAHADLVRVPTDVQKQVGALKELQNEKFDGIQRQFDERDERDKRSAQDTKTALSAALEAAKELVAQQNIAAAQSAEKQTVNFSKQIDAQAVLIQTTVKASDEKIDDLRTRLLLIEGKGQGLDLGWKILLGAMTLATFYFALRR